MTSKSISKMPSVAYVHSWGLPAKAASSVHVMKMCQAFQQASYPATLYVPDEPDQRPPMDEIWHHFGIVTPFELRFIHALPLLRKHDVAFRAALRIRSKSTALAYGRNLAAMMWTSFLGVPTGIEVHDAPSNTQLRYLNMLIRGRGFRRLIVISKPLKELYMEKLNLPEDRVKVESDAVDMARFEDIPSSQEACQQLGLDPQQFTVGYAGSLYDGRGINIILEVAAALPDVFFLIVGGNQDQIISIQQKLAAQNMTNIKLEGFVSNTRLPLYLAASDMLLMPYQLKIRTYGNTGDITRWISPMKMFEYMATNRPIVSSDLPVLREVLNSQNSILVTPEDTDQWINSIKQLRDNPELGNSLAKKARKDVQYYTWDNRVQRIVQHLTG